MRHPLTVLALASTLALAACHNGPQPMPTQAFAKPGVTMKLDPPGAPDCKPDTTYKATLSWSVDGMDTTKTDVHIGAPDGQLFARSNDRSYHAETGNWVKPGLWFLLSDRKSGEILAALQAGPKPCP